MFLSGLSIRLYKQVGDWLEMLPMTQPLTPSVVSQPKILQSSLLQVIPGSTQIVLW